MDQTTQPQPLPPISAPGPESASTPSSAPATPSSGVDPDYVRYLEEQAAAYQATVAQLNPYADQIKYLLENPKAKDIFDVSRQAFEDQMERSKPKIAPGVCSRR